MKDIITSREDVFLAKIAGRDVDINTLTPPVATSVTEKLLLETADRLDRIEEGGGGGGYEEILIAKNSNLQWTEDDGGYVAVIAEELLTSVENGDYTKTVTSDGFELPDIALQTGSDVSLFDFVHISGVIDVLPSVRFVGYEQDRGVIAFAVSDEVTEISIYKIVKKAAQQQQTEDNQGGPDPAPHEDAGLK